VLGAERTVSAAALGVSPQQSAFVYPLANVVYPAGLLLVRTHSHVCEPMSWYIVEAYGGFRTSARVVMV